MYHIYHIWKTKNKTIQDSGYVLQGTIYKSIALCIITSLAISNIFSKFICNFHLFVNIVLYAIVQGIACLKNLKNIV